MRKKIVIEGTLCDVCGRIAGREHMYVGGYNDWSYVSPKTLKIKMTGGPFYNICSEPPYIRGKPRGKPRAEVYETVCPRCAAKLSKMYDEWRHECWRDGEQEREQRRLDFERKWADGSKKDAGQKGEEESREGATRP